jgi:hypothetical protein
VLTVSAIVVDAVIDPDVPVIVAMDVPAAAVLLALKVSTLEPVVGLVPGVAVTPAGKPATASITLPVNPPASVTVMVSIAVAPSVTERVGADELRVKLGVLAAVTVSAMVVDAVIDPDVPVIVTVAGPTVAVPLAVNVTTQLPVVGLAKFAVTPLRKPDIVHVTAPVKPPVSVTVIVSAALAPCVTDNEAAEADRENPGVTVPPPPSGDWILCNKDSFTALTGVAS